MFLQEWGYYIIEHIAFFGTCLWLITIGVYFIPILIQIGVFVILATILDPFITSKLKGIHTIKTYRESAKINFPLFLSALFGVSCGLIII